MNDIMTITMAAIMALRILGKPSRLSEIFDTIIENGLYTFGAANPQSVLSVEILRRCQDVDISKACSEKYFYRESPDKYGLLDLINLQSDSSNNTKDCNDFAKHEKKQLIPYDYFKISKITPSEKYFFTLKNRSMFDKFKIIYKDQDVLVGLNKKNVTYVLLELNKDCHLGDYGIEDCEFWLEGTRRRIAVGLDNIKFITQYQNYILKLELDIQENSYKIIYLDIDILVLMSDKYNVITASTYEFYKGYVLVNQKKVYFNVFKEIEGERIIDTYGKKLNHLNYKSRDIMSLKDIPEENLISKNSLFVDENSYVIKEDIKTNNDSVVTTEVKGIALDEIKEVKSNINYVIKVKNSVYKIIYKDAKLAILLKNDNIVISLSTQEFLDRQFTDSEEELEIVEEEVLHEKIQGGTLFSKNSNDSKVNEYENKNSFSNLAEHLISVIGNANVQNFKSESSHGKISETNILSSLDKKEANNDEIFLLANDLFNNLDSLNNGD